MFAVYRQVDLQSHRLPIHSICAVEVIFYIIICDMRVFLSYLQFAPLGRDSAPKRE